MPITPCTKDYIDAAATGRLLIMHYETNEGLSYLANLYGWTGGVQGSIAAGRTNDLIKITLNELSSPLEGSKFICGDINGDTANFPALHALLQDGSLIDLGAHQGLTGKDSPGVHLPGEVRRERNKKGLHFRPPHGPWCHQEGGGASRRRDTYPPSCRRRHLFDLNGPETKSLQMPSHAADLFDEAVDVEVKKIVEAADDDSKEDLATDIEDLNITINTIQAVLNRAAAHRREQRDEFADGEFRLAAAAVVNDGAIDDLVDFWSLDDELAESHLEVIRDAESTQVYLHKEHVSELQVRINDAKAEQQALKNKLNDLNANLDEEDKPTAAETSIRKNHRESFHACMNEALAERVQRLNDAVVCRDTEQLWMLITAAIEAGFFKHLNLSGTHADKMKRQKQREDCAQQTGSVQPTRT